MFFTSAILIAFFCFAFYLIWNQFLKKDTRLSTGLQVLRRKITDLENLSLSVEAQMDRQRSLTKERTQNLESLLRSAKAISERLEKNIKLAQALENKKSPTLGMDKTLEMDKNFESSLKVRESKKKEQEPFPALNSSAGSHLKMVKTEADKKLKFGKSPFSNIDFVDSP